MGRRHYFAIGAVAATTIFCETALTRLFSVVEYYHGAFLAISVALFGFAVSGVFVMLRPASFSRERLDANLARYALLFSFAIPVSSPLATRWKRREKTKAGVRTAKSDSAGLDMDLSVRRRASVRPQT
jgi:hypothetical protein